jgi:hypothetical protein
MATVGNATHYHNLTVSPRWAPSLLKVAQVGSHQFYRPGYNAARGNVGDLPNMNAQPMVPESETSDLRMASMVLVESPAKTGVGGPLVGGPEPASAPADPRPATGDVSKAHGENAGQPALTPN